MISLSSTGNSAPEDEAGAAESISAKRPIRSYRILLTLVTFLVSFAIAEGVGERIYPSTTESHPNAHGYYVIASAVNENLSKLD